MVQRPPAASSIAPRIRLGREVAAEALRPRPHRSRRSRARHASQSRGATRGEQRAQDLPRVTHQPDFGRHVLPDLRADPARRGSPSRPGRRPARLPVTRSSNRSPTPRIRSACWIARLTCTSPCMPGMPRCSGCDSGKPLMPSSVVITGMPVRSARRAQLLVGAGQDDAVAGHDERPLGLRDEPSASASAVGATADGGTTVRRSGCASCRRPPVPSAHVRLRLLHVLGDVHQHRPRPAFHRDGQRLAHRVGQVLDVLHQHAVLGDRLGDADDVGLLERVAARSSRAAPGR